MIQELSQQISRIILKGNNQIFAILNAIFAFFVKLSLIYANK